VQPSDWNPACFKACLFDFGGTLDADGVTWQDRLYALYGKRGLHVDREVFRRAFYAADDSLTDTHTLDGRGLKETIETQGERVWQALGMDMGDERMRVIAGDFIDGIEWHVERNRQLLALLGSRYRLGIVSNFYGNLDTICEDLGIREFFDCIVDSSCEGVVKPDPRIFQAALDRIGAGPEETVFVGDNPHRDMEGAKGVGMPHIWLAGKAPAQSEPCCPGDPVIRSLADLESLLMDGKTRTERGVVG
jgi:putative hydrolase of the HAD superfamily